MIDPGFDPGSTDPGSNLDFDPGSISDFDPGSNLDFDPGSIDPGSIPGSKMCYLWCLWWFHI